MATHTFNAASFRAMFPIFANVTTYPDATLSGYWTMATGYIFSADNWLISDDPLQLAINLMTAHLAHSYTLINAGQNTVIVQGAAEGTVNVSMVPPPIKTGWQYWLATSPYGVQLWALLQCYTVGGFYIGGSLERGAIRKVGGVF